MFIDDPGDAFETVTTPPEIQARSLLLACIAEAGRQAAAMTRLDAALGAALAIARGSRDGAALVAALTSDLQQADRLRQELDGLSQAIALLAGAAGPAGMITASQIRVCTPLAAQQHRLLTAPQGAGTG